VHGVQLRAEAARWHGDLDDVRKVPLDNFRAHAAFVACHRFHIMRPTRVAQVEKSLGMALE
jgi:hypothetical protein